jgi:hypothetical protein
MSKELENSLDPMLELYYKINDQGLYVYFLSVYVANKWIMRLTEDEEFAPDNGVGGELGLWVSYQVRNHDLMLGDEKAQAEITCNPSGLPGEIVVLIKEFDTPDLNDLYQPKADGKAIIRFEKATHL